MLTAIRSLIVRDRLEVHAHGRVDYLDLHTDPLRAPTSPGFVGAQLALLLESDGRPSSARIELRAHQFAHTQPLSVEGGHRMVAAHMTLAIPILRAGDLTISVIDDARRGRPLHARWGLAFDEDVRLVDPALSDEILAQAHAIAAAHDQTAPSLH
jgi:hypothetical protein